MARKFDGRFSEDFINKKLYDIFELLQHLNENPSDVVNGPDSSIDGALWLDRFTSNGDLKYSENGTWHVLFGDKFRLTTELLNPIEPENPLIGQLWLKDGVLHFFSGVAWVPVKAVSADEQITDSAFENFIFISPINAAGKKVVQNEISVSTLKDKETSEIFEVPAGEEYIKDYSLKGEYKVGTNAIDVYINGILLPSIYIEEIDANTIRILSVFDSITPEMNKVIDIRYIDNTIRVDADDTYSQYILPNEKVDKVFLDHNHDMSYEKVSDITVEYPTTDVKNKIVSVVHVNPLHFVNGIKYYFATDINNPIINIINYQTEFYGIKDNIGNLLINGKDFTSVSTGIILSEDTINRYDIICAIKYEFDNTASGKGTLERKTVLLSDETSIYIGNIEDIENLAVYVQGFYVSPDHYTIKDGYLHIKLQESSDIDIILWPKKIEGDIKTSDIINKNAIVKISDNITAPVIFASGLAFVNENENYNIDYTITKKESEYEYLLTNAGQEDTHYVIVETKTDDETMFLQKGVVLEDTRGAYIPINQDKRFSEYDMSIMQDHIILLVNGVIISKADININYSNEEDQFITVKKFNFKPGMEYQILYDETGRYLYSDKIYINTVSFSERKDFVLAYVENQFINDFDGMRTPVIPNEGYENQLINIVIGDDEDKWYLYKNKKWQEIDNEDKIESLDKSCRGFLFDNYTLAILKELNKKQCTYYAYKYANSIDNPLYTGIIYTKQNVKTYRLPYTHSYKTGANNLQIWQNGLRQYPTDFEENSSLKFTLKNSIDGTLLYVVEPLENNEKQSFKYEILNNDSVILEQSQNNNLVLSTNLDLCNTGNVRVFISGIRQPKESYKILDNHKIMFFDKIALGNNYPNENVYFNNKLITFMKTHPDSIMIETREDTTLKEITLPVRYKSQKEWTIKKGGDKLPESILKSNDFVMIYINGLAYGNDYTINKANGNITLNDSTITDKLGLDPIETYFNQNPIEYEKWKEKYGEYEPKNNDYLIFEWR